MLDRPAAARRAGFDAVEFWWPFHEPLPSADDVDQFVDSLNEAETTLSGLNLYAGDLAGGDRGILSTPGSSDLVRSNAELCIELGLRLGCRTFNVLYGNRDPALSAETQDECAEENLEIVASIAGLVGATVLIEPLSGLPNYPLRLATDVFEVIDRVERRTGHTNLRLLADFYHLAANGEDLHSLVERETDRIGHVQIADFPGRHEPGTGELAIGPLLGVLFSRGYLGYVGAEYVPTGSTTESFGWLSGPWPTNQPAPLLKPTDWK